MKVRSLICRLCFLLLLSIPLLANAQHTLAPKIVQQIKENGLPTWEMLYEQNLTAHNGSVLLNHSRTPLSKTNEQVFDETLAPFYHGVASGDPLQDRVIIWTRVTPPSNFDDLTITGTWRVCTDKELTHEVRKGSFTTSSNRDFTVKIDVDGLEAGTVYYYVFTAFDTNSLIGRTKTLPSGSVDRFRMGITSCSHYQAGYFNAYGRLADQNDVDVVLHLGDYIYEYGIGSVGDSILPRLMEPSHEILTLGDYRTRHSLYRLDKDLRRLHQQYPFINIWDDHEIANNTWTDGAQNHSPETEGDFHERKAAAYQVFLEWLPIREAPNGERTKIYRSFQIGNLIDLMMLDTRHEGRMQQTDVDSIIQQENRTILGQEQYEWLENQLLSSKSQYRILGNQVVFSPINTLGIVANEDSWDGYAPERAKIYSLIKDHDIDNFIILTGDIHMALTADIVIDPSGYKPEEDGATKSIGVELVTSSVTSSNLDELEPRLKELLGENFDIEAIEALAATFNPHLHYYNLSDHGYFILDVDQNRAQADYFYVGTKDTITDSIRYESSVQLLSGERFIREYNQQAPPVLNAPDPAPNNPPIYTSIPEVSPNTNTITILSNYPNPTKNIANLHYALNQNHQLRVQIYDATGKLVKTVLNSQQGPGIYSLQIDVDDLNAGTYFIHFETKDGQQIGQKIIVL